MTVRAEMRIVNILQTSTKNYKLIFTSVNYNIMSFERVPE